MKKRITYILLCTFIFNSVFYFFLFPFLIQSYKERFEEGKKGRIKTVTRVIEIDRSELNKLYFVHKNEFIFEGRLYDILNKKEDATKIIYSCYHDKEEEKAIKEHEDFSRKEKNRDLNNIFTPGFVGILCLAHNHNIINREAAVYFVTSVFYPSVVIEIPNPPPNINS